MFYLCFSVCPGGSKCVDINRSNLTCTPVYLRNEGETCRFLEDCSAPLQCLNNKCTRVTNTVPCGSIRCEADSECQCGKCVKMIDLKECQYEQTFKEWRNCWEQYNCPYDQGMLFNDWFSDSFYETGTCLSTHCGHIARKFLCCAMNAQKDSQISWTYLPSNLQCPRPESQVIMVAILLIGSFCVLGTTVFILGFLGMYLFKRNKGYEELQ